jgi:hypothetical protein
MAIALRLSPKYSPSCRRAENSPQLALHLPASSRLGNTVWTWGRPVSLLPRLETRLKCPKCLPVLRERGERRLSGQELRGTRKSSEFKDLGNSSTVEQRTLTRLRACSGRTVLPKPRCQQRKSNSVFTPPAAAPPLAIPVSPTAGDHAVFAQNPMTDGETTKFLLVQEWRSLANAGRKEKPGLHICSVLGTGDPASDDHAFIITKASIGQCKVGRRDA